MVIEPAKEVDAADEEALERAFRKCVDIPKKLIKSTP